MTDSNDDQDRETLFCSPARSIRGAEIRLDAVCDLIDQELNGEGVDDLQLQGYARRIAADVDTVMAAETSWLRRTRCEV